MKLAKLNLEKQLADYVIANKEKHYRLAFSYTKNTEDALDIVQEAIYKALASIDTLREPDYIKTWFYKIMVNTSLTFLRKQKKLVIMDDEMFCSLGCGNFDNYEDLDLKKAMEALPDNYRSIIILRYFEDLKIEDIADILGENASTVKTRLYRSLEKLRINMEED